MDGRGMGLYFLPCQTYVFGSWTCVIRVGKMKNLNQKYFIKYDKNDLT